MVYFGYVIVGGFSLGGRFVFRVGCLFCFVRTYTAECIQARGEVHKLTWTSTSLRGHSTCSRGTYTGSRVHSQSSLIAPVLRALPAVTKVDG